jgi:uncharacterized protein
MARQLNQQVLDQIVEQIVKVLDPEKIILFGSHARERANNDSDVDIAIIAQVDEPRRRHLSQIRAGLDYVPVGLDLVIFTPHEWERYGQVKGSFQSEIRETGVLLHERGRSTRRAGVTMAAEG